MTSNSIEPSHTFAGHVVSNPGSPGRSRDRHNIVGAIDELCEGRLAIEAIGIGNPTVRYSIGEWIAAQLPAVDMPPLVHPSVIMDAASCVLGSGTILSTGAILTVNSPWRTMP